MNVTWKLAFATISVSQGNLNGSWHISSCRNWLCLWDSHLPLSPFLFGRRTLGRAHTFPPQTRVSFVHIFNTSRSLSLEASCLYLCIALLSSEHPFCLWSPHRLMCLPATGNSSLQVPLHLTTYTPSPGQRVSQALEGKQHDHIIHNLVWRQTNSPQLS